MLNIMVTTYPFGHNNKKPVELLKEIDCKVFYNDFKRKYTKGELIRFLLNIQPEIIIAGTEKYDKDTLDNNPNLKMISRVGIGIDGIDLKECKKRGIIVTNTPEAPSNAVAELTVLQILNMLRKIQNVSEDLLRREKWNRYIGRELKNCLVGIIGLGRIGTLVAHKLGSIVTNNKIWLNDIDPKKCFEYGNYMPMPLNEILKKCDIITIHIPLQDDISKVNNHNLIGKKELSIMKDNVRLLNLSRGGIINEGELYIWLKKHRKACVALDSFESEPYNDILRTLGNAYLTPHIGSCTIESRLEMEVGAVENVEAFICKNVFKYGNRVI